MQPILSGIDQLCLHPENFQHLRAALVTNNAATTADGVFSRVALLHAGINLVKLFSPEHGLSAKGNDGSYQHNHVDFTTKIPVISLYGNHLIPTGEDMAGIDCVFFDIPDVGCRFYTYLWTMTYVMEACATFNKPFVLLDRPNPLGGDLYKAEGPMLDEINCASFIGRWSIPVRHCCTLGELANFFSATRIKNINLQVVKVKDWNRQQTDTTAGRTFTPTSPAIQNIETALLYPGMGLLEGINVNEGRGTHWPFTVMGAPWMNAKEINEAFTALNLPGVKSASFDYTPSWGLYENDHCYGLRLSVTDMQLFNPVTTGIALLQGIISLYPTECKERLYPTVANPSGSGHLDKLTGIYQSFEKFVAGNSLSALIPVQKKWSETIQLHLLY